jgi:hypothetical protein
MSVDAARAAFQRWVDALNQPRDAGALAAALADDVCVDRHAPGECGAAPRIETFTGVAEVARWLARTPAGIAFSLAGAPWPDADGAWGIEYAIDIGAFHNGGRWLARLAGDGRIAALWHHPFALPDRGDAR